MKGKTVANKLQGPTRRSQRRAEQSDRHRSSSSEELIQLMEVEKSPTTSEQPQTKGKEKEIPPNSESSETESKTESSDSDSEKSAKQEEEKKIAAKSKGKGVVQTEPVETPVKTTSKSASQNWFVSSNAHSHYFYTKENLVNMHVYENRGFIVERNVDLESFKRLGIVKTIQDHQWENTITGFKGFVPRIVQEFYANIPYEMHTEGSVYYHKVYVRGHIYDFSPKVICDFLKIPLYDFDEYEKEYNKDRVATHLLGFHTKWPVKSDSLPTKDLTFAYYILHKIAMSNWWPTTHFPTVAESFSEFLYDVGIGRQTNLGQIIFKYINALGDCNRKNQKLVFPCLITAILQSQHPLIADNENLTGVQPILVYKSSLLNAGEGEEETVGRKKRKTKGETSESVAASAESSLITEEIQQLKLTQTDQQQKLKDLATTQQDILKKLDTLISASLSQSSRQDMFVSDRHTSSLTKRNLPF